MIVSYEGLIALANHLVDTTPNLKIGIWLAIIHAAFALK